MSFAPTSGKDRILIKHDDADADTSFDIDALPDSAAICRRLDEDREGLTPEGFTIKTMPARLKKVRRLREDFRNHRKCIESVLERLRAEIRGEEHHALLTAR